jgi:DNA-binding response OmpR family regulator
MSVGWNTRSARLTYKEFLLARLLIKHMPHAAHNEVILETVWKERARDMSNVQVLAFALRRRIAPLGLVLVNAREFGYRIERVKPMRGNSTRWRHRRAPRHVVQNSEILISS